MSFLDGPQRHHQDASRALTAESTNLESPEAGTTAPAALLL
jgi:hypothetical protein